MDLVDVVDTVDDVVEFDCFEYEDVEFDVGSDDGIELELFSLSKLIRCSCSSRVLENKVSQNFIELICWH